MSIRTLGLLFGASLLSISAVQAQDVKGGFSTPSGNIRCLVFENNNDLGLRCDIGRTNNLMPPRPQWCEFNWGDVFGISENSNRGELLCHSDTLLTDNYPTLPYGAVFRLEGFVCKSEPAGLNCINSRGHGFFLSRAAQRLF
jgi:hypothetical protein